MGVVYFRQAPEFERRNGWVYPDTLRVRGSVIPRIVTDVVVLIAFTSIVTTIHMLGYADLNLPSVIAPALSVVVGLILAFRTNTAYDRFWEGRKLWSSMEVQVRNFSRLVWIHMKETQHPVPAAQADKDKGIGNIFNRGGSGSEGNGKAVGGTSASKNSAATLSEFQPHGDDFEKVTVINLLLAYIVSVKHHLRQEFGTRYYDLEYLLPEGFVPCAATDNVEIKMMHDRAMGDRQRKYNEAPWRIKPGNEDGQISLPLEIAQTLQIWVATEARGGRIDSFAVGNMVGAISSMVDIFTNMERIVFTPIPLAYSIHLRQVVYLYCSALPFTFLNLLGWGTIPLMTLVSFTLFGIEGIGREIENPFGKDSNDLHMDEFCHHLRRELEYTVNLKNVIPGAHAPL
jgi:putative membrane protein